MKITITKRDTLIMKGFAILCIAFHNYFHKLDPSPGENEFDFAASRIGGFFHQLADQPGEWINILFSYLGHYGVQVFIFLSGFGLTLSMLNRQRTWGEFVLSRLKKLYSLLFTALLAFFLGNILMGWGFPNEAVMKEIGYKLLFIHTLIPHSGQSVIGVWWFFGLIFQLYLLFPLLFRWFRKWGWKAFVAVSALSYGLIFLVEYGLVPSQGPMVMMNAPGHLPEFCLGVLLAMPSDRKMGWGWLAVSIAVFCLGQVSELFYPFTFLAVTVIALFAYQGLKRLPVKKQWLSRPLAYFGGISMALFAVHGIFREPVWQWARTMNTAWGHLVSGLVFMLIVWAIAIAAKTFYDFLCRQLDKGVSKEGLCQWIKLNLFLLLCLLVVRLFFFLQVHFRIEVDASQFLNILKGFVFDGYLVCHAAVWLLLPYLLFHRFFPKTAYRVGVGLVFAYVAVAALLTEYYCHLYMPLDHVVLVYSLSELLGTATSSATITVAPFLWFLGTMAVVVLLWLLIRKHQTGWVFAVAFLVVAWVVAALVPYKTVIREERYYQDHTSFCLAVNQPSYAYVKITDYLRKTKDAQVFDNIHVDDTSYPFLRKADDPDVLGPFVEQTSDSLPPNFVFIIVESLGQRLTGVDHPTISFTPFIDSLKQEGLNWKHCLATSERTFGVLPSVFASAPHGRYGFSTTLAPMPNHYSLLRDMKRNGYQTSYYYGAADEFSRFDSFLKANKLDYIYFPGEEQLDSANFERLNEFQRWGVDDRETLAYVKAYKSAHPSPRPWLDVIMTLTTHEPFYFEGIEPYEERVKAMMETHPEMTKEERRNIKKNLNIYACFLYMDDCVRDLMAFYRSQPDYENTIFVITGDHRMGPLRLKNPLSQFTVPLLIYSPLIRQPRSMDAVVSHLDLTPTLNAYLHDNYDYVINENCHWISTSLDTSIAYENTHKQAFMLNNRDVVDYVNGDYMISNDKLYRLDEELRATPYENDSVLAKMRRELEEFDALSRFAVMNDHLVPAEHEMEVLRDDVYDFELSTSPIFSHHLREDAGNHYVFMDSELLYAPLFEPLLINTDKEDLLVNIAFDLQSMDTTKALPQIGVELGSYYMSMRLNSPEDVSLNTGKVERFHRQLSIMNEESKGQILKIYLFNPQKNTMKYDNIRINVSVVKE